MKENKPLMIAIEDAKQNIISNINDTCEKNCLSYYYLEIIIKDIYQEVLNKKNIEFLKIKDDYEQSIKESDK